VAASSSSGRSPPAARFIDTRDLADHEAELLGALPSFD
jgi:hypothetical protein